MRRDVFHYSAWLVCLIPFASPASADTVLLDDGSRIHGTIEQVADGKLTIDTSFAGALHVDAHRIRGIATDTKRLVALASGDRLGGRLAIDKNGKQRLTDTAFGDVTLNPKQIVSVWLPGRQPPADTAMERKQKQAIAALEQKHQQDIKQVKSGYEKQIETLQTRTQELEDPWSGSIGLGLLGAKGNSNNFSLHGTAEADRDTDFDRLHLYFQGDYEEQNSHATVNHVLAGGSLERDFNRRWFAFGSADFEKDKFQNLSLRSLGTVGVGDFFIRDPDLIWKGLAGVGYQHESYTNGTVRGNPLMSLGYDLTYRYNGWLKLKHKLTYFPTLTDPMTDYRLVSNFVAESPLVKGEPWKVQLGVRNQYDPLPVAGAKSLDTTYQLNLTYDWK